MCSCGRWFGSWRRRWVLEEASRYISLVVQAVGTQIDDTYLKALGQDHLSREQVAEALVGLKRRIKGDFFVIEQDDSKTRPSERTDPRTAHRRLPSPLSPHLCCLARASA
ncbi:hypothetical protein NFX46_18905 [Streptomyces phaeoluteigriseus]|uniref:Uncharacterized protein n=1 Tax=Streptomyces phaeoluteigriseus TaxID=114686 RepID=A0ABY4ZBE6_9ACTN|nr:hypothetical protein [Streptomyces phaeoluteigriseus]USQ85647.1 hypothetical protein NFX46_18905 [Streptomyces phaeoluteigriseus]